MNKFAKYSHGFSLIEAAVVVLFVSLAMVPVIANIGGTTAVNSDNRSATNAVKNANRATQVGNSLMQAALSGDASISFNLSDLPAAGQTLTTPMRTYLDGTGREYGQPFYYQWVVQDHSYYMNTAGGFLGEDSGKLPNGGDPVMVTPLSNHVVYAVLLVFDDPNSNSPVLTMPTYLYLNDCGTSGNCGSSNTDTAIVFVIDRSGSMQWGEKSGNRFGTVSGVGSPWLKNRYAIGNNVPDSQILISDIYNDETLDTTFALPLANEDPSSSFSDVYPYPNGVNTLNSGVLKFPQNCDDSSKWSQSEMSLFFAGNAITSSTPAPRRERANIIERICGKNSINRGSYNSFSAGELTRDNLANWETMVNENISRFEALRNALITFLVTVEHNNKLVNTASLGLVSFSNSGALESAIEVPTTAPINGHQRFQNFRRRSLMINRAGNGSIQPSGSTRVHLGMKIAADMLYESPASQKIMVVIADGDFNGYSGGLGGGGSVTTNPFRLAEAIGDGSYNVGGVNPEEEEITVYAVGVIGASPNQMQAISGPTPNGQFFFINSVADVRPMFDQIIAQIERLILLQSAQRHRVPLGE